MNILDTSALIAFIKKEKGWKIVQQLFEQGEMEGFSIFIHQINFIEFIYKCIEFYGDDKAHLIIAELQSPFLGIVNFMDTDLSFFSGYLKAHYQLSLGDTIGLAYTKIMNGHFFTADRALEAIATKEKIKLTLLR